MSETLLGVLIGSMASILGGLLSASFVQWNEGRKWRREKKLEHLSERKEKLETLRSNFLVLVADDQKDSAQRDFEAFLLAMTMPSHITGNYLHFYAGSDPSHKGYKERLGSEYADLATSLTGEIEKLDQEIARVLSK